MSAMKLHIHLASCRIIRRLSNHPAFRVHSSSSPAHFVKQHRRPFSSTRNASNTSPGPKPGLNILTALPALCLLGFAYKHLSPEFNHPQALDVPDPIEGFDGRTVKYEPFLRPPTAEEVNENLRWEESSRCLGPPTGVLRYDAVRIPSNQPCEDYLITVFGSQGDPNVIGENLKWFVWGVFDGHAGFETAITLHEYLVPYIVREFLKLPPEDETSTISSAPPELITQTIKSAFLRLDADILETGAAAAIGPRFLADAIAELAPGYAGSCALLSIYDRASKLLRVACTGDSRAVLGRRNAAGVWEAIPLSVDQTGFNEAEAARIRAEHPDEPDVIKNGRLLGLAVTRAFGDGRWKWSRPVQDKAAKRFYGPAPREGCLTPPYLTAEPVITTTKIEPQNRDFVIMASDGLWDNLTNAQAVELVGRWLETHDPEQEPLPQPSMGLLTSPAQNDALRGRKPEADRNYTGQRLADPKSFVVVDENAATHLARNALGGGDEDLSRGAMMAQPPFSRRVRDDITIQVIFFGEGNPSTAEIENW